MREMHGLDKETKGTFEFLHDGLCEDGEVNVRLLVEQILGKFSDALGIGLCLEPEALALQESSEFLVIGDDSIVDNGEFPVQVRSVKKRTRSSISTLEQKMEVPYRNMQ